MNSIALLKKEAQSLKKANQEHKRSELITNLNKEIADQDLIIETLRAMIPNGEAADKEIVRALTKGPPKIRVETREELKMEIKKLKGSIAKATNKKEENGNDNVQKPTEEVNLERRNSSDTQMSVKTEFNEIFFQQIDLVKKENEDLRLNLKAQQVVIQRYEEENNEKMNELNKLRSIRTDFAVLKKKYDTLQNEYDKIKEGNNKKFVMTYDKEMRLEELEIINKTQQGKLNIVEKNVGFEMNNYKQRLEDFDKKNNDLQADNDKILIKHNDLLQRNKILNEGLKKNKDDFEALKKEKEATLARNEIMIKNLKESLDKIEIERNEFEAENVSMNNDMFMMKGELTKLRDESQDLKRVMIDLKEQLRVASINNEREAKTMPMDLSAIENVSQTASKPLIIEKPKFINNNSEFFEENKLIKKKLKELTIRQIELTEKSDALELELRLRGRKESNAFIKARQQERQSQKIQNMQDHLKDLKSRASFQRMDSNLSHASKNLNNSKMLDSNLSYSQSVSKIDSKISTPIKSEELIDTDSDITTENKQLRKIMKQKQEEELNLKMKVDSLEKEVKMKAGKDCKKDLNTIENEKKIRDLGERISNISFTNSDISRPESVRNSSILDSSVSNLDSNIDSIVSHKIREEKIETDSNISGFTKK